MNANHIFNLDPIAFAMINYDNKKRHHFTLIDLAVMESVMLNTHTTDVALARMALCSLSTVKRSINKLCEFGLISKHISEDNTKTIALNKDMVELFINTYFYAEPYHTEYLQIAGACHV